MNELLKALKFEKFLETIKLKHQRFDHIHERNGQILLI